MKKVMQTFDGEQMKQIIYSFTKWTIVVRIDTDHANFDSMVEYATIDCKRQLSRKVEDFIKVEVDKDRGEVIGVIYLPYIADEELKNLQQENNIQFDRIIGYKQEIMQFKHKIEQYQKLPWYKRIWTPIR